MTASELRPKRIAAGIPAIRLAAKASINRSRISAIECGHVQPNQAELNRLEIALIQLIQAKSAIRKAAIAAGWPGAEVV